MLTRFISSHLTKKHLTFVGLIFPLFLLTLSSSAYVELESPLALSLADQASSSLVSVKEVREFYSFFCGHCFKQEAFIHQLIKVLPADVALIKNHVNSMPGQQLAIEDALTKALITAQLLKIETTIVAAIFERIHVTKQGFKSVGDIKNLFIEKGVLAADFDNTFASFKVAMEAKKMLGFTHSLRAQGVSGVPTLIINGKYKPEVSQIKDLQQYKRLIRYLVNKDDRTTIAATSGMGK
jgi:protein dithiol oxidoreductase (disulfide-forming)